MAFLEKVLTESRVFDKIDVFDHPVFDRIKVVVLTKSVCWVLDCIQKKPGGPVRASETHCCTTCSHAGHTAEHGVTGGGTRGGGCGGHGAYPGRCPWYGSGTSVSLRNKAFSTPKKWTTF